MCHQIHAYALVNIDMIRQWIPILLSENKMPCLEPLNMVQLAWSNDTGIWKTESLIHVLLLESV